MHGIFCQVSENITVQENCKDQHYSLFKKQWIMYVVWFYDSVVNLCNELCRLVNCEVQLTELLQHYYTMLPSYNMAATYV
jgi:hypothetical protein